MGIPASRSRPLPIVAVPIKERPRSCMDQAGVKARFSGFNHEHSKSEFRQSRPRQVRPGRGCNLRGRNWNSSERECKRSDFAGKESGLESAG
jgi:hypothetical protein